MHLSAVRFPLNYIICCCTSRRYVSLARWCWCTSRLTGPLMLVTSHWPADARHVVTSHWPADARHWPADARHVSLARWCPSRLTGPLMLASFHVPFAELLKLYRHLQITPSGRPTTCDPLLRSAPQHATHCFGAPHNMRPASRRTTTCDLLRGAPQHATCFGAHHNTQGTNLGRCRQ